jgi:hypothetical protein
MEMEYGLPFWGASGSGFESRRPDQFYFPVPYAGKDEKAFRVTNQYTIRSRFVSG